MLKMPESMQPSRTAHLLVFGERAEGFSLHVAAEIAASIVRAYAARRLADADAVKWAAYCVPTCGGVFAGGGHARGRAVFRPLRSSSERTTRPKPTRTELSGSGTTATARPV